MTKEEIKGKIMEMLVEQLGVEEEEVSLTSEFGSDLGADSLDLVELIMSMEEEFEINIPDEDVEQINTVGDAVEYVSKNM